MLESKFSKRNLVIKNNSENVQKERKDKLVRNSSIKYTKYYLGKKRLFHRII